MSLYFFFQIVINWKFLWFTLKVQEWVFYCKITFFKVFSWNIFTFWNNFGTKECSISNASTLFVPSSNKYINSCRYLFELRTGCFVYINIVYNVYCKTYALYPQLNKYIYIGYFSLEHGTNR